MDWADRGKRQILTLMSGHKKAGRFPIRMHEGPAKNLLPRRTEKRPARHEDTMVLAGISYLVAKKLISNLAGSHAFFAEIRLE